MVEFVKELVYKQFKFPDNDDCNAQAKNNYLYINFVLKLSGMNMYSEDFSRKNPILLVTITNVMVYFVVNAITIQLYWGDLLKVAFCVVTVGCGVQVRWQCPKRWSTGIVSIFLHIVYGQVIRLPDQNGGNPKNVRRLIGNRQQSGQ
jgi:hypothetical protein